MAYVNVDCYGQMKVRINSAGVIVLSVGSVELCVAPDDAPRVRDDLSRAILEAAQASAKAVKAEGETA